MKKYLQLLVSITTVVVASFTISVADAFYDEIMNLRKELQLYETAHASDFSDVLAELDEITGSVFTDVKNSDWFHPYVTSLAEWNIISGYKDTNGKTIGAFKAGNRVTVAEALKIAMKAAKVDESTCAKKPKHSEAIGHWAQAYVTCGENMGLRILKVNTININREATRAEVVGIVLDTFKDSAPAMFSTFRDTSSSAYESDIAYAALLGIVSGDKNKDGTLKNMFRPTASINRAEVSKIVYERLKVEARKELATTNAGAI